MLHRPLFYICIYFIVHYSCNGIVCWQADWSSICFIFWFTYEYETLLNIHGIFSFINLSIISIMYTTHNIFRTLFRFRIETFVCKQNRITIQILFHLWRYRIYFFVSAISPPNFCDLFGIFGNLQLVIYSLLRNWRFPNIIYIHI